MTKLAFTEKLAKTNRRITYLAESEKWDELLTLSRERDLFIRRYFDDDTINHSSNATEQLLDTVRKSDELVANKLELLKKSMIDNSLTLKYSQSAIKTYRSTQDN